MELKPPVNDDVQEWERYLDKWEAQQCQVYSDYDNGEYSHVLSDGIINAKMHALYEIMLRIVWIKETHKPYPLDNPNTWTLAVFKTWFFSDDTWYTQREDPDEPSMAYLDMYDLDGFSIEIHNIKRGARYEAEGSRNGDVIDAVYDFDPDIEAQKNRPFITEYHPIEFLAFPNLEYRCALKEYERDGDSRVYNPEWVRRGMIDDFMRSALHKKPVRFAQLVA